MPQLTFSLKPPINQERGVSCRVVVNAPKCALPALAKEEKRLTNLLGKNPNASYRLSFRNAYPLLQEMAVAGTLLWEDEPLIADFFSRGILTRDPLSEEPIGVWKSREVPLLKAPFLGRGPPHYVIQPPFLRFFDANILFDDLTTVPIKPRKIEILPLLTLKDYLGAFAELLFDYEGTFISINDFSSQVKDPDFVSPRDLAIEKTWEQDLLEVGYQKQGEDFFCSPPSVKEALAFLLECGWNITTNEGKKLLLLENPQFSLKTESAFLFIEGTFEADEDHISLGTLMSHKEPFPPLSETTSALLPPKYDKVLAIKGTIIQGGVRLHKSHFNTLKMLPNMRFDQETESLFETDQETLPDLTFAGTLRPYQQKGLNWLVYLEKHGFHGILADEMGLGKTVQILAFLSTLKQGPHLIIVPTSLLYQWQEEIKRFLPKACVCLYHGQARTFPKTPSHFLLTTYGTLKRDLPQFTKIFWHTIVLDEAHLIKNPKTQIFESVTQLKSQFRISITGTPIENRFEDLVSQFRFLMPDLLADLSQEELKKRVRPFVLRRKKEEVAKDLPPKIEQTIWLEMEVLQKEFYEQFHASARSGLLQKISQDGTASHRMEILETILRLKQLSCHPALLPSNLSDVNALKSVKMETVIADVEELIAGERNVLIYSQFTQMLKILQKAFLDKDIKTLLLTGETKNRQELVAAFQKGEVPIFLLSLKAGGVGLNLTAADTVILFDPWWNVSVENQALDRAHRIGQTKTVFARRYLLRDTIEEKIEALKQKKKMLADDLFNESKLTEEELLGLL